MCSAFWTPVSHGHSPVRKTLRIINFKVVCSDQDIGESWQFAFVLEGCELSKVCCACLYLTFTGRCIGWLLLLGTTLDSRDVPICCKFMTFFSFPVISEFYSWKTPSENSWESLDAAEFWSYTIQQDFISSVFTISKCDLPLILKNNILAVLVTTTDSQHTLKCNRFCIDNGWSLAS